MKILVCALGLFLLYPGLAQTEKSVTIESQANVEIRGEKVHSPFIVVMTDTTVTVNGREVANVRYMVSPPMNLEPKPDPNSSDYINWLTVNVMSQAESLLVAGAEPEVIKQFMRDWLEEHVRESKTVSLVDRERGIWLRDSSWKEGQKVGLPMPMMPQEPIDLQASLEVAFRNICDGLRAGKRIEASGRALFIGPASKKP